MRTVGRHALPRGGRAQRRRLRVGRPSTGVLIAAVTGGALLTGGAGTLLTGPGLTSVANAAELPAVARAGAVPRAVIPPLEPATESLVLSTTSATYTSPVQSGLAPLVALASATTTSPAQLDVTLLGDVSRVAAAHRLQLARQAHLEAVRRARLASSTSRSAVRVALPAGFGARVLAIASQYRGVPYRWGGQTPAGFDCSGFVDYVFARLGRTLPHSAAGIYAVSARVSPSQVRPGDLVFVYRGGVIYHVAIYAGPGLWWEASTPGRPVGLDRAWSSAISYGRIG